MSRTTREAKLMALRSEIFDVAIIGAGAHGAAIYHELTQAGYRVLILDQADYASGCSQASGMLAWGGLLYLRNADLATVRQLCHSRERLLGDYAGRVTPRVLRLALGSLGGFWGSMVGQLALRLGVWSYWALNLGRRQRPRTLRNFPEQELLKPRIGAEALSFEEAGFEFSDARFVLAWIFNGGADDRWAFNYCRVSGGEYDRYSRCWRLDLADLLGCRAYQARAKWVVNAAGVWTDKVQAIFQINSPYRHLFSKGLFLGLARNQAHQSALICATRTGDFFGWLPWGPVALFGPTEQVVEDLDEALQPHPADVRQLLEELNRLASSARSVQDVVSLRFGARPIATNLAGSQKASQRFSRRPLLFSAPDQPWLAVYGGNLTNSLQLAQNVCKLLNTKLPPAGPPRQILSVAVTPLAEHIAFDGLPGRIPSPRWCNAHEDCWSLDDYLRRRTNLACWVPRGGLGRKDEYLPLLEQYARDLHGAEAQAAIGAYQGKIRRQFDEVLARV